MAKQYDSLSPELNEFITNQKMFFVATALENGKVNLSPKGTDSFRILGPNRVLWLNLTGSGNETAAHLLKSNRITLMFCSFEQKPLILRLYGTAKTYHPKDDEWDNFINMFPEQLGARQLVDVSIEMVQTSCGFAVPFMEYKGERDTLEVWANNKGENGINDYWKEKNKLSLDGDETGIL